MSNTKKLNDIFLLSGEDKDIYCLDPIRENLRNYFINTHDISTTPKLCKIFIESSKSLLSEGNRICVLPSSELNEIINLISPGIQYTAVGIEHGIAPFKKYTYGPHLLQADYYLSPTKLWAERLSRLYPDQSHKIRLGGYPRLETIRELRESVQKDVQAVPQGLAKWAHSKGPRKLVILSWGTNAETLDELPDLENVAYVYHPGDMKGMHLRKSVNASLFCSTPEITSALITLADEVYGDFSSLTLEAIALGIPTSLFIDRRLYISDCDLPAAFFDRSSGEFAAIPETPESLPREIILDAEALRHNLASDQIEARCLSAADLPSGILPPDDVDNRELTASLIYEIACDKAVTADHEPHPDVERARALNFLLNAYSTILGRPADAAGIGHYLPRLADKTTSPVQKGLALLNTLAQSPEGRRRFEDKAWDWPEISIERLPK